MNLMMVSRIPLKYFLLRCINALGLIMADFLCFEKTYSAFQSLFSFCKYIKKNNFL